MLNRAEPDPFSDDDRPIGEMIGQVLDDGRAYAQAELALLKVKAHAEVNRFRSAAILAGAGLALGFAALIAFALTVAVGFSRFLGPFFGSLAAFLVLGAIAGLLFYLARGKIAEPLGGEEDDDDGDDDAILFIDGDQDGR